MSLITSILTGGSNSHETTSEEANAVGTDFISQGVVGSFTNTVGVAPSTGNFSVNAQGTPDMTVAVGTGVAYVTATPSSQGSQKLRVKNTASANVTISANSSGSTKYDWLYLKVDATAAANPNTAADDVATLTTSRSSSATSDDGTPPTYGLLLAVVTVSNGASSITNGNIADRRVQSGLEATATPADGWVHVTDAWVYASATTITVPTDATTEYSVGDKIRLTQTTVKYFYVTAVTSTTLTVNGGTDYTVANAAITDISYSKAVTPLGFPQYFTFAPAFNNWTIGTGGSAGTVAKYTLTGKTILFRITTTLGSSGQSVGGNVTFSAPLAAVAGTLGGDNNNTIGHVQFQDTGTNSFWGVIRLNNADLQTTQVLISNASSTYLTGSALSSTVPHTWAAGDSMMIWGMYQIA